ncbi:MAG: hypothetical protein GEU82_01075, partial [Luteitalea sp.]|nr:hypothetical protein [Luteitalea sp.]
MRTASIIVLLLWSTGLAAGHSAKPVPPVLNQSAQANSQGAQAQAARPAAAAEPTGDLAQLMRGILFPNSNLIFDAQSNDPGAPKKPEAGGGGATA